MSTALGLHCCAQALSSCGEHGLLIAVAFLVAEHSSRCSGFSSCSMQLLGLSGCSQRAQLLHSMIITWETPKNHRWKLVDKYFRFFVLEWDNSELDFMYILRIPSGTESWLPSAGICLLTTCICLFPISVSFPHDLTSASRSHFLSQLCALKLSSTSVEI